MRELLEYLAPCAAILGALATLAATLEFGTATGRARRSLDVWTKAASLATTTESDKRIFLSLQRASLAKLISYDAVPRSRFLVTLIFFLTLPLIGCFALTYSWSISDNLDMANVQPYLFAWPKSPETLYFSFCIAGAVLLAFVYTAVVMRLIRLQLLRMEVAAAFTKGESIIEAQEWKSYGASVGAGSRRARFVFLLSLVCFSFAPVYLTVTQPSGVPPSLFSVAVSTGVFMYPALGWFAYPRRERWVYPKQDYPRWQI